MLLGRLVFYQIPDLGLCLYSGLYKILDLVHSLSASNLWVPSPQFFIHCPELWLPAIADTRAWYQLHMKAVTREGLRTRDVSAV